jgi:hypothetical protein
VTIKKDIKYYQELAQRMIKDDDERDTAFVAYDNMDHCHWDLPPLIKQLGWVTAEKNTDPHDSLSTGTTVLATLEPKLKVQPTHDSAGTKKKANEWERNLRWQLKSANRRRQASVQRDVTRSALKYDEVIINVVDLDYQIQQKELFKGDTKREKAARRYGRFQVNTYNPKDVHVRYSNMMPEAVLLVNKKPAQAVIDEWGDRASSLEPLTLQNQSDVTVYDYTDYEIRFVWVVPEGSAPDTDKHIILGPEKQKIEFLPWVAMVGGSTLEDSGVHKRRPIMYADYMSGRWHTQNVILSLITSETIAHSGQPKFKQEGTSSQEVQIDYGEPERVAKVPPGSTLDRLPPIEIDRALAELIDRYSAASDSSMLSRILKGGDSYSGEAFASLNLRTQTAVGALKPAKDLAEKALAEMFVLMLLWVEFTGKELEAYGIEKDDRGKQYSIKPEEIEHTALYVEVELTPDVPTDRQQRINASSMAVEALGYSKEAALEDIGVEDPQAMKMQEFKERLLDQKLEEYIAQKQMALQMQMQQAQMQMQMQAQQAMAQQQQPQPGMMPGQMPARGNGVPGGQATNPDMGGLPGAMSNPNVTRENVTGQTRRGEPIEEGLA